MNEENATSPLKIRAQHHTNDDNESHSHSRHSLRAVHSAGCMQWGRSPESRNLRVQGRSASTPASTHETYSRPLHVTRIDGEKEESYTILESESDVSCNLEEIDPVTLRGKLLEVLRKYRSMRHLQQATRSITGAGVVGGVSSQDLALERVIDAASEIMKAERIVLFLLDQHSHELHSALSNCPDHEGIRISMSEGLAGYAARTGKIVCSENAQKNREYNEKLDRLCGYHTQSVLAMPVTDEHGHTLGVIQAANRINDVGERSGFNEHDIYLLDGVASVAGNALSKLKLYLDAKRAAKVQSKMLQLTKDLAAEVDLSRIIKTAKKGIFSLLSVEFVKVFLVDSHASRVFLLDVDEKRQDERVMIRRSFEVPRGLVGTAVDYRQTVCVDSAPTRPDFDEEIDGVLPEPESVDGTTPEGSPGSGLNVSSCVCVPVKDPNGKVVAVIEVINKKQEKVLPRRASHATNKDSPMHMDEGSKGLPVVAFNRNDIELLESIAASSGVCLDKAMMFAEISKAHRRTATLLEIIKTTSMQADLSRFVRRMIQSLYKAIHADRVTLFLVDKPRNALQAVESRDIRGQRLSLKHGICGYVARTGHEVVVRDAYQSQYFNARVDKATNYITRSVLCLPILDRSGRVMAVLQALNKIPPGRTNQTDSSVKRSTSMKNARFSTGTPTAHYFRDDRSPRVQRFSDTLPKPRGRSGSTIGPLENARDSFNGLLRSCSMHSDGSYPGSSGRAAEPSSNHQVYSSPGEGSSGFSPASGPKTTRIRAEDKAASFNDVQFSTSCSARDETLRTVNSVASMSPEISPATRPNVGFNDPPVFSLREDQGRTRQRSGSMLENPATRAKIQGYSSGRRRTSSESDEYLSAPYDTASRSDVGESDLGTGRDFDLVCNGIFNYLDVKETSEYNAFGSEDVAIAKACCVELAQRFSQSAPEEILFELRALGEGPQKGENTGTSRQNSPTSVGETALNKLTSLFASYTSGGGSSGASKNTGRMHRSRSVAPAYEDHPAFQDIPEDAESHVSVPTRRKRLSFKDKIKPLHKSYNGSAPFDQSLCSDIQVVSVSSGPVLSTESVSMGDHADSVDSIQTSSAEAGPTVIEQADPPLAPVRNLRFRCPANKAALPSPVFSTERAATFYDADIIVKFANDVNEACLKRILNTGQEKDIYQALLTEDQKTLLVQEVEMQASRDEQSMQSATATVDDSSSNPADFYPLPSLRSEELESFSFDVFSNPARIFVPSVLLMLHRLGPLSRLGKIKSHRIIDFAARIGHLYRPEEICPFHNFMHGFSVCQFTYALLLRMNPEQMLLPIEQLSLMLAALAHDVDHPSVSNSFLASADSELALQYNDCSVLENYHASIACRVIKEVKLLEDIPKEDSRRSRNIIIQSILATDMSKHFDLIKDIKQWLSPLSTSGLDLTDDAGDSTDSLSSAEASAALERSDANPDAKKSGISDTRRAN
eukprot:gb/GECG01014932.1/.p1 GENE.gb/GECG01014932.1/~~gb/GECG01014932.1/.p1  ORF type:complete len:1457 (+),score=166.57 gb/GECG01014932.1/:1-4371(+)